MTRYTTPIEIKKEVLREYIRANPTCTCVTIERDTKIKIERIHLSLKQAYQEAGIELTRRRSIKRTEEEQKRAAIAFLQDHPTATITQIMKDTGVCIPRVYGSIIRLYQSAGINYPIRKKAHGVADPVVAQRCYTYEKKIIQILTTIGQVKPKVRISTGIVDCLFLYKNKMIVVEIKDFRGTKNITMTQIKQLLLYMRTLQCYNGFLICPKESFPKRKNSRNIYINPFLIKILSEEDLKGL